MSSARALQPAAGVLLCLGTGYAVFSLGDSTSEARRRLASHATDARREVLLAALTKRLWPHQATAAPREAPSRTDAALPAVAAAEPELFVDRFYVVTGPDAFLASLAHRRLSDALISNGNRNSVVTNQGLSPQPPARLVVPYDCLIGTGCFSSLLEQQLLSWQTQRPDDGGGSPFQAEGTAYPHPTDSVQQEQKQEQRGEASNDSADGANAVEAMAKATQEATAVPPQAERPAIISWRDAFVLGATRALMNPEKLDQTALWALERALSPPAANTAGQHGALLAPAAASMSPASPPTAVDVGGNLEEEATRERRASVYSHSADREETEASGDEAVAGSAMGGDPLAQGYADILDPEAERKPLQKSSFVLEIEGKGSGEPNGRGREPAALCGELARWAWKIGARELGHVIISSANPWVLAELQQALQEDHERLTTSPEGTVTGADDTSGVGVVEEPGDASVEVKAEVVVVRVALPSAAEREKAVVSIAEELGVDHRLTALDISMLATLTGGRRAGLVEVLDRVQTSFTGMTVAAASETAVNEQALALASTWGLLSHDDNFGEVASDNRRLTEHSPSAPPSSTGVAPEFSTAKGGDNAMGRQEREEWAALWEALGALSLPRVAVGAGPVSAPVTPPGSMPPAELLGDCGLDSAALLRLTRDGWLELSPATPPGSGTVLHDPGSHTGDTPGPSPPLIRINSNPRRYRPPVTVYSASVLVESLARLDRSFVGAPPLRLAAFRRLLDSAIPQTKEQELGSAFVFGAGDGAGDEGEGFGGGYEVASLAGGAGIAGAHGGDESSRRDNFVLNAAGSGRDLERAGCLIEASVLARLSGREEATLTEDGEVLSSAWEELNTVRKDLQRQGKGDASEGEWAEVQLELIRQERAVVARAYEMRERRSRLDNIRHHALGLEKRASILRRPSLPRPSLPRETSSGMSPAAHAGGVTVDLDSTHTGTAAGDGMRRFSTRSEEAVIMDAEGGVRLLPLREAVEERGVSAERGQTVPERGEADRGVGGAGGGRRWGYGVRLWRWMRGR